MATLQDDISTAEESVQVAANLVETTRLDEDIAKAEFKYMQDANSHIFAIYKSKEDIQNAKRREQEKKSALIDATRKRKMAEEDLAFAQERLNTLRDEETIAFMSNRIF